MGDSGGTEPCGRRNYSLLGGGNGPLHGTRLLIKLVNRKFETKVELKWVLIDTSLETTRVKLAREMKEGDT